MDICVRRQSCRKFADRPVQHDDLVKCVEAARLAPSACNSQPWSFVVVEKPEIVEQIAKGAMVLGSNATIDTAKAFIVVVEEYALLMPRLRAMLDNQYFAKGDLGAATVYLCLEAESLGLGSCVIACSTVRCSANFWAYRTTNGSPLSFPSVIRKTRAFGLRYANRSMRFSAACVKCVLINTKLRLSSSQKLLNFQGG